MPARRELTMRQLRQMLRLHHDGVSAREIGRTLGVNSTPTLVLASGERITGGLSKADLLDVLDAKP